LIERRAERQFLARSERMVRYFDVGKKHVSEYVLAVDRMSNDDISCLLFTSHTILRLIKPWTAYTMSHMKKDRYSSKERLTGHESILLGLWIATG
jgi:hypothetical protein